MNCSPSVRGDRAEKCARQIGLVAVAQEGVAMQVVDLVDARCVELPALTRSRT